MPSVVGLLELRTRRPPPGPLTPAADVNRLGAGSAGGESIPAAVGSASRPTLSRICPRSRPNPKELGTTSAFVPLTQLMSIASAKATGQHFRRDTDRKSPDCQE